MRIIRRTGLAKSPLDIYEIPIEPEEYNLKPLDKEIAIFDTETDPFAPGRVVKPFSCGFLIPRLDLYKDFWGDDCIDQFFAWIAEQTAPGGELEGMEFVIFVHNGGNFDFYFIVDYFDDGHSPFIINGRLVKVIAQGIEFRDSYSMIPVPLAEYDKDKIDYRCMERGFRDIFRIDILKYQKRDCTSLGELVVRWVEMFGNRLTMASVALPTLRSYHGFDTMPERIDADLRPYYFGGRTQCFATGVLYGNFKIYDINSSYPDVMRRYQHPISSLPRYDTRITAKTHFAHIRAWSLGALPVRNNDGSLSFPIGTFDFHACIHEIRAGLETKTLRIIKVYSSIYFDRTSSFEDFVDRFYSLRQEASASGDEVNKLFYKLVLNSSYGKFAQDPRKYENWLFNPETIPTPEYCGDCHDRIKRKLPKEHCELCENGSHSPYGWYLHTLRGDAAIYAQPQRLRAGSFFNVATAASITSAARASLLYGLRSAQRPVYCDTDSIICENLNDSSTVVLDRKLLGAWKLEAQGNVVCIAGKKLYAVFDDDVERASEYATSLGKTLSDLETSDRLSNQALYAIKKASKGVKLTADQIARVCEGEVIEYEHPVPKFHLDGDTEFTNRKIRKTG